MSSNGSPEGSPDTTTGVESLTIDVGENLGSAVKTEEPSREIMKETGARVVAYFLVGTFSGAILLTLLISLAIIARTGSSEHAKLFTDTIVPLFEGLNKFLSPVFGPLLAFVLGYYFSKEQSK
jgi:hypothetical protein